MTPREIRTQFCDFIDFVIESYPQEKIDTLFEMCIEMCDEDFDLKENNENWEKEYRDLFNHHLKTLHPLFKEK